MTKYVTKNEIVEVIKSIKTSTMLTLDVETEIKVSKSNPYRGAITKRNSINGQIGFWYDCAVNNELSREDKPMNFIPQPAIWMRLTDSKGIVTNADGTRLYVYIRVLSSGTPRYFMEGNEISKKAIELYLPEHKTPATQSNLDKEVVVRTFALDHISNVKMLGNEFVIAEHVQEQERELKEAIREPVDA